MLAWLQHFSASNKDTVLGAGVVAIVAAAIGFVLTSFGAWRQRRNQEATTRLSIYAQLHRIATLSRGHLAYLEQPDKPPYIWLPVFNLNLPSFESVERISVLTPREVYEITSFFYVYQEQLAYLLGNARPKNGAQVPGIDPPVMPAPTSIAAGCFGYDYSDPQRRKWLKKAICIIADRAERAQRAVGAAIRTPHLGGGELRRLIRERHPSEHPSRPRSTESVLVIIGVLLMMLRGAIRT